jgi:hypothetical protein
MLTGGKGADLVIRGDVVLNKMESKDHFRIIFYYSGT